MFVCDLCRLVADESDWSGEGVVGLQGGVLFRPRGLLLLGEGDGSDVLVEGAERPFMMVLLQYV